MRGGFAQDYLSYQSHERRRRLYVILAPPWPGGDCAVPGANEPACERSACPLPKKILPLQQLSCHDQDTLGNKQQPQSVASKSQLGGGDAGAGAGTVARASASLATENRERNSSSGLALAERLLPGLPGAVEVGVGGLEDGTMSVKLSRTFSPLLPYVLKVICRVEGRVEGSEGAAAL
jgi:hypothetical protein